MTAYETWVAAGRPWRDARPIGQTKDQLRVAFPQAVVGSTHLTLVHGGIQTNDAHLLASPPEDHTPYPANPWPVPLPPKPSGYVVCANDYMHGVGGLDCNKLFPLLLEYARSGHRPWCKYLNWRGQRYDIRNGWSPVDVAGHFDHIHESTRSDYVEFDIRGYPDPFLEVAMMNTAAVLWNTGWLVTGLVANDDPIVVPPNAEIGAPGASIPNKLAQALAAAGGSVVTPEQLAEVTAAAHAGAVEAAPAVADAVGHPLTAAETAEAARQGAELAEDS